MGKKKKKLMLIGSVGIMILIMCLLVRRELQSCMKVPIISEEKLNTLTEVTTLDISQLSFNGADVSIDLPNNSIYISQNYNYLEKAYRMQGKLETKNPEYSLFFLDTGAIENIPLTVREGNPFTLIIRCGDNYQKVNLIITTLPILYLDLEATGKMEDGRDLMSGKLTLWDNYDSDLKKYKVTTSPVEWHVRGNSSKIYDKLSWKVNLKKESGENKNLELLGLGSDDDWILNGMSMDDTNVKEKFTQELWNELVNNTNYNYKMTSSEYVELFINGAYQGLYIIQRRIDEKYLELDRENDLLFKGINTWEAEHIYDAYEIISSPLSNEVSYDELKEALSFKDGNKMNIENFIDVSLLLQLISGYDNSGYKNMFYFLKKGNDDYELSFIPWDTDLSLGVTWGYDYEDSISSIIERYELETVKEKYPNIDMQFAKRWNNLRMGIFSEEKIFSILNPVIQELESSGVIQRDEKRWGLLHEGEDNIDNLRLYIRERLIFLDEYYAQFL